MRIVIDLQGAQTGSRYRGIGRYSLALAKAMVRHKGEHEILIALNGLFKETIEPIRAEFEGLLPNSKIYVWNAIGPVHAFDPANQWRKSAAELVREAFLESLKPDIVHITSLVEGFGDDAVHSIGLAPKPFANAVTFYDVIPLIQSEVYLKSSLHFQQPYYEKLNYLEKADVFLAISESSRKEAIQHLHASPQEVINIAAAADKQFKTIIVDECAEIELKAKYGVKKNFIMYSGATDDRKNHIGLIKAFSLLSTALKSKYQLVLVGGLPQDHKERFLKCAVNYGLGEDQVIVTDRVSDGELVMFYNLCDLYVFASWHEGFGLPALEAMSCGAAVIGSDSTSIPEVIGRSDALFNPHDPASIALKMTEVLNSSAFQHSLKEHGLKQSKKFSWDKSARKAMNALAAFNAKATSSQKVNKINNRIPAWLIPKIERLPGFDNNSQEWIQLNKAIRQNHADRSIKTLFLDVSELVQRDSRTGVQRVVRSISKNLINDPPKGYNVKLVYATNDQKGYFNANSFFTNNFCEHVLASDGLPIDYAKGDIFLGLDMQHHVIPAQRDFYQDLRNNGVAVYFYVYDLLPVLSPQYFPEPTYDDHFLWLNTLACTADGLICISRTVAEEMYAWLSENKPIRLRPLKIGWVHIGADIEQSLPSKGLPDDATVICKKLAERKSFLCVGTIEPRKGHDQVLRAFELLWEKGFDFNLSFVGKCGWNVDGLMDRIRSHPEAGRRLFWFDGVSDEYLQDIYSYSDCLIAASVGEGFGLPIIEAAQKGIPIIVRDIPVFREVAGKHALYFEGLTGLDLASCVEDWLQLESQGRTPDVKKLKLLTWKQSTKNLLRVVLDNKWQNEW